MIIVSQNTFYFILEEDVYIFDHIWKYMTILHITYIRIVSQYHIYIYVHHINHYIMGELLYNTGIILYDVIYIYIFLDCMLYCLYAYAWYRVALY